jgi:hypothetical protein
VVLTGGSRLAGFVLFSALVWFFFEAYNFRLQNWHYFGVPMESYIRWPGYFIAFGTVLPAILETEALLDNLGVGRSLQGRPLRVSTPLLVRAVVLGILMLIAPLIGPQTFFPLVWVGLVFLLDPLLIFLGGKERSLLGQAEKGSYGRFVRLLLTGLVCGLLWEFWNNWAGSKWIYSIPTFDFWHVFEMPLLGYLGFPVFALECYLLYEIFEVIRDMGYSRRRLTVILVIAFAIVFSVVVIRGIDESTLVTYKILI